MGKKNIFMASIILITLFLCGFTVAAYNGLITLEWNKEQFDVDPIWNTTTLEYDFHISRNNIAKISNAGDVDTNVILSFVPIDGIAAEAFFRLANQTTVGSIEFDLQAGKFCEVEVYIAALPDRNVDMRNNFNLGTIMMVTSGSALQIEISEETKSEDGEKFNETESDDSEKSKKNESKDSEKSKETESEEESKKTESGDEREFEETTDSLGNATTIGSDESKIEETIEITGESDSSSGSITSSESEEMQGSD